MTSKNYHCKCSVVLFLALAVSIIGLTSSDPIFPIPNGSYEYVRTNTKQYGFLAIYTCKEGFALLGYKERTLVNGQWTHDIPRCLPADTVNLQNGAYELLENESGFHLTYTCNEGFELSGHRQRSFINGKWSQPKPFCFSAPTTTERVTTTTLKAKPSQTTTTERATTTTTTTTTKKPEPSCYMNYTTIENGVAKVCGSVNVEYICNEGFTIYTSNEFHDENRNLTQSVPRCKKSPSPVNHRGSDCDNNCKPFNVNKDILVAHYFHNYNAGQYAEFKCVDGFQLVGNKESFCNCQGWIHPAPKCVGTCPDLVLEHGRVEINENKTTANFFCNSGYTRVGNDRSDCNQGNWSHAVPECVGPCSTDLVLKNGKIEYYNNGNLAIFKCDAGYLLNGVDFSSCSSGKWNNDVPTCVVPCSDTVLEHGKATVVKNLTNSEYNVVFECDNGYQLFGENKSVCESGNRVKVPKCVGICPDFVVEHGGVVYGENRTIATFYCNKGYSLIGNDRFNCYEKTSNYPVPKCTVSAPKIPQSTVTDAPVLSCPFNYTMIENGVTFDCGSYKRFSCNKGFRLYGSHEVHYINGNWTSPLPICTPGTTTTERTVEITTTTQKAKPSGTTTTERVTTTTLKAKPSETTTTERAVGITTTTNKSEPSCYTDYAAIENGVAEVCRGNNVTAICNEGFTIYTSNEFHDENGKWTQSVPRCKKAPLPVNTSSSYYPGSDCDNNCKKFHVKNDTLVAQYFYNYNSGQYAEFRCVEGFRLEGNKESFCNCQGWTHPAPKCVAEEKVHDIIDTMIYISGIFIF